MKTEKKLLFWSFHISGCFVLFAVFLSIYRILLYGPIALNLRFVFIIELLYFLTVSVLLLDKKPADKHLYLLIIYLFIGAVLLILSPDFLNMTEHFYVIMIGLIGFLLGLNALLFHCFHAGEK